MFSKIIAKFEGEYKANFLGKKNKVYLYIQEETVNGLGASYYDGKFTEREFEIEFQYIKGIEEKYIEENRCLLINYSDANSLFKDIVYTIYFPNIENFDDAMKSLSDMYIRDEESRRIKFQEEQDRKEEQLLEKQKRTEECQRYFNDCYKFHITNGNPYFKLRNDDLQFACIYIDEQKNLNFLTIDGYNREESNACIPYEKIHYYEKAGNVYYTSDINAQCSNYGGSFTDATISKGATAVGGLLFGAMGLTAGALLTHEPAKLEMPTNTLHIMSEVHKIDDRSVILNYYSDVKQQFMDMELPANIYNFLQTHLPEKKYSIVVEIEKENAVKMQENSIVSIEGKVSQQLTQNNDMDVFKNRIKKLKIMYDHGILTEEEFANEKKRILNEI